MTRFSSVQHYPPDAIFGIAAEYKTDPRKEKLDLTVGIYKSEGKGPILFSAVAEVEKAWRAHEPSKEYLPILGCPRFLEHALRFCVGDSYYEQHRETLVVAQTVGGTSALRVGADFVKAELSTAIFLSNPTWPNHFGIVQRAGLVAEQYPYYDERLCVLEFEKLKQFLDRAPQGSVFLFHASCHNPTGVDLSHAQWKEVLLLCKEKNHLPFFDFAYQGLAKEKGSDNRALQICLDEGIEFLLAYSFSKNMGLYGDRLGFFAAYTKDYETKQLVESNIKNLIRANFSNPPRHGSSVALAILSDPTLKRSWLEELDHMRLSIASIRKETSKALLQASLPPRPWSSMLDQNGMFSLLPLTKEEVLRLKQECGVYMTGNGRINMTSLTPHTLPLFIKALESVL